jgi:hypothetical protein
MSKEQEIGIFISVFLIGYIVGAIVIFLLTHKNK